MNPFLQRHASKLSGVLHCFDRILIHGSLPQIGHAQAMSSYLYAQKVRIFDFQRWAEPFRAALRDNADRLARDAGLQIEFIRRVNAFRKEDRIQEILEKRGSRPGLVHIFSAMEACPSFQPWHDKMTHRTFLRPDSGKCLHYYFYFIDPHLGLAYVRVPTWAPFRLQIYLNGHHALACALRKAHIPFTLHENAFLHIGDYDKAQRLAEAFEVEHLHGKLNAWAQRFCPIVQTFSAGYHWSLSQVEFSSDLVFSSRQELAPLYEQLTRTAIHAVKAPQVATFLGRPLHPRFEGEAGSRFQTRVEGTCIRHAMAKNTLKLYDKFRKILRIECVSNDVTFFKHHRTVVQRDGTKVFKLASLRKSIYSLPDLRKLMLAANERYLAFLATLDDPGPGLKNLEKTCEPVREKERSYKGFNVFSAPDAGLFQTLLRGEFNLSGFQAKNLRAQHPALTQSQISRLLKRLRLHGLIKKIGNRYKYYLTVLGRTMIATALRLRELVVIPSFAASGD